jgi:hypothetical protein
MKKSLFPLIALGSLLTMLFVPATAEAQSANTHQHVSAPTKAAKTTMGAPCTTDPNNPFSETDDICSVYAGSVTVLNVADNDPSEGGMDPWVCRYSKKDYWRTHTWEADYELYISSDPKAANVPDDEVLDYDSCSGPDAPERMHLATVHYVRAMSLQVVKVGSAGKVSFTNPYSDLNCGFNYGGTAKTLPVGYKTLDAGAAPLTVQLPQGKNAKVQNMSWTASCSNDYVQELDLSGTLKGVKFALGKKFGPGK